MSEIVQYYYYLSNLKGLRADRISPTVEPFQEAFELVRDRFNAIPGLCRQSKFGHGPGSRLLRLLPCAEPVC